ncbi:MAG: acyl-CoA dehydrogenase [Phenylobacterium sp.]|uniref:acyl-CoA dehydrogenase family protein n=1 Tax=Phenylobacterium sp. TaxID=1871053 RepID=UPI0025FD6255|nr:acyl-CoA dehydrogenase family protein [Phenylobacterium sp.]MBA4012018.1 acyl-CoA dehydrogenase [Phenylobacterium sp.]
MDDAGLGTIEAFRTQARAWIAANFPADLAGQPAPDIGETLSPVQDAWRQAMGACGWGVPTWPAEYGGGGLSPSEARVLRQELTAARAYNPIGGMGVMLLGPTLLEYGTDAQKREHIPPIARGELNWCQGFSEPGAGSDLASLQTRAQDMGDHYRIDGQKVWTSDAQHADWCFCLVRTDLAKKHEGISFVLFPMDQPGVEVRPIALIAGSSPFCETFLTGARAEKKDLLGPLGGGWTIAKRLLQHERSAISEAGEAFGAGRPLPQLAAEYVGLDEAGCIADSDLRMRVVQYEMDNRVLQQTADRVMAEAKSGGPSAATSILKNAGTRVLQDRAELTIEIMGAQGLGWEGEAFTAEELEVVRIWLHGKATTIFGGSHEVQNNIIAKRILGLPDPIAKT